MFYTASVLREPAIFAARTRGVTLMRVSPFVRKVTPSERSAQPHALRSGGGAKESEPGLKRRLSILRALIFDSSVEAGRSRRAAAPNGPDTRPLLSVSAASMAP